MILFSKQQKAARVRTILIATDDTNLKRFRLKLRKKHNV